MFNTYTAKPVCWNGWISDSYCSLKPLCSGMGEVVRLVPLRPNFPHPLALYCHYPVSKCRSASIVVTGTLRVKPSLELRLQNADQQLRYKQKLTKRSADCNFVWRIL